MGLASALREQFHVARARLFLELMHPQPGATVLDLGGGSGSFSELLARQVPLDVTVADLEHQMRETVEARGFRFVALHESEAPPFGDGEFDFVIANSVIEHVTLPKATCALNARDDSTRWRRESRLAQRRFANEIRRIGKAYFVQTPHKHFPVDQHVHLPFVQYLSHNNACRLVTVTERVWFKKCQGMVDWELFTPVELHALFPEAFLFVERLAGLPKSIIAYRP